MDLSEQIRDLNAQLTAIMRKIAAQFRLTFSQVNILLSIPVEGIFMSQLAHKVGIDVSTATRNLVKLENRGLIHRERGSRDKRKVKISLSPDGEALVEQVDLRIDEVAYVLQTMMSMEDRENLYPVIEALNWNLMRYRAESAE